MTKKALIISVSEYDNAKLPQLDFVKNDGTELYNILKSHDFQILDDCKLIGRVEWLIMRNAIINFFQDSTNNWNDTLVFYFSGHGLPDGRGDHYLTTSEINPSTPDMGGFPFYEITNNMERSRSKRIVIILDCCYSGAVNIGIKGSNNEASKSGREAIVKTIEKKVEDKIREGQQKSVLASSLAGQESYKMEDEPYSMFTYFLLEGLKGSSGESVDDNGNVTPYFLGKYVSQKITEHLIKRGIHQEPIIKVEASGEIVLAHYPDKVRKEKVIINENETLLKLIRGGHIAEFNKRRREEPLASLDLHRQDLERAKLNGADLHSANLAEANLEEADLRGANLADAKLYEAKFYKANLAYANLERADLYHAHFPRAYLYKANLAYANLERADLGAAHLREANLARATLKKAELQEANLLLANLERVNLTEADLVKAYLGAANLIGANLTGARLSEANLIEANIKGVITIKEAKSRGAIFDRKILPYF